MHKISFIIIICSLFFQIKTAQALDYSRNKTKWYIGFGVGGGVTWIRDSPKEDSLGNGILSFKVGAVITPKLLLGFEMILSFIDLMGIGFGAFFAEHLGSEYSDPPAPRSFFGAVITYFPLGRYGFYVKGGVGLGLNSRLDEPIKTRCGLDWRTGLGYEFQIRKSFVLGGELVNGLGLYFPKITDELLFQMTFSWY